MIVPDPTEDQVGSLNRLLVVALLALARAGGAGEACRIAARAWSLLRHSSTREAERLTAVLHSLSGQGASVPSNQGDTDHG